MSWLQRLKQQLTGQNLEFDAVKEAVEAMEHGSSFATDEVDGLMQAFRDQRDILRGRIGSYPGDAVNAKDWLDGVGLGHLAVRFAEVLEQAELFEAEFLARELAVNIGCIVEGHYHHVIGPRMVALIRASDRVDRPQHAEALCDAVAGDFMWILAANIEQSTPPTPEDAISIWSLKCALEREAAMTSPPAREFNADDAATVLARVPTGDE